MREIIEEFLKVTTYYDLIALSYSILLRNTYSLTRRKSSLYTDLLNVYFNSIENGFIITFNNVKSLIMNRINKYSLLNKSFYNDIYDIFYFVDDHFAFESFERIGQKRLKISKALNDNVNSTGIMVLRKVKSRFIKTIDGFNEKTFRAEETEYEIFRSQHLDFLKLGSISDLDINIIEYNDNSLFTDNIEIEKGLRVEFVPVVSKDIYQICERTDDDVSFEFVGFFDAEHEYAERYFELLKSALDNDSDLIIFPELLLTKTVKENYESFLSKYNSKKKRFVFLGSQSLFGVNEAFVVDEKGRAILSQKKKKAYIERKPEGDKWEKLIFDNKCNILQINKFGRILVVVCADVYYDIYNSLLTQLSIDFLIVVSFTQSLDIITHCVKFSRENHLITLVSNSCSAFYVSEEKLAKDIDLKKKIGAILLPSKKDSDRDHFPINYSMNDSCLICDKGCDNRSIKIMKKLCSKSVDAIEVITIETE
jgi:hypothetical protein